MEYTHPGQKFSDIRLESLGLWHGTLAIVILVTKLVIGLQSVCIGLRSLPIPWREKGLSRNKDWEQCLVSWLAMDS
jgi:hypothetical protein